MSFEKRYKIDAAIAHKLTKTVASGMTARGPSALCLDSVWQEALDLVGQNKRIAIISGFYVPAASAPETDGPPGSIVLARALLHLGHDVTIWTDSLCFSCFLKCAQAMHFPESRIQTIFEEELKTELQTDLLIYIERLGRARNGLYCNMRGEDISSWTTPIDSYAERSIPVIAIGDGGNEVGMGNFLEPLSEMMPDYADCLCTICSDVCIPVDVSNWGAYALVAALSYSEGKWLGQTDAEERIMLEALCSCGVVDGVSKECTLSVDGMPLIQHQTIRNALENAINKT